MIQENENKIINDLIILSQGNLNYTSDFSDEEDKTQKISSNPYLGKKRNRNNSLTKSNDNLESFDEKEFNSIKANNNKQNEQNNNQENKNPLVINEEENSTNFSSFNDNHAKRINKKILIEKYKCSFDLKKDNVIPQNNKNCNCLSLWNNIMNIQDLSYEIENLMKELKLDIKSIDTYNKLKSDISTNKITINRLNIMINFLSNSNIINFKRKIIEVLLFELLKNNQEYFELVNYKPSKPNLEELKNLIYIKLKGNNKKYQKEIQRLNELGNKNYEQKNGESYIKIISKKRKKTAQINMVFQFLKFCKKEMNPFVHASGQKINFYLLPKHCLNNDFDGAKYFFTLDDIISKGMNQSESQIQNLTEINQLEIYVQKKLLPVDEVVDFLLSNNKIFNFLNDNFSNEIKQKQTDLNKSLEDFNKKFEIFSGIVKKENFLNIKIQLKNELLNANREFIEQLDLFDSIISDIFCSKFNEEITNSIELMKQCINSDICYRNDIVEKIEKLNPEKANDYLCLKIFRLSKILVFLRKQKEKIIKVYQSLYEENEKYYNEIIDKTQILINIVNSKYNVKNELLFEKWKESGPKIKNKYCKIEVLRQNFIDLMKTIELDINYSYDEKFTLWLIKNNFSNYLLN